MLLFEGTFGTILHTGDCRLDQECLQSLPEKYLGTKNKEPKCSIDYIFLDCTFGRFSKMPSRHSAIRQVICSYALAHQAYVLGSFVASIQVEHIEIYIYAIVNGGIW